MQLRDMDSGLAREEMPAAACSAPGGRVAQGATAGIEGRRRNAMLLSCTRRAESSISA